MKILWTTCLIAGPALVILFVLQICMTARAQVPDFYDTFRCVPAADQFSGLSRQYEEIYVCVRGRK